MTQKLAHRQGTVVYCNAGHAVCTIIKDLHRGDANFSENFGDWREGQVPPVKGQCLPILCKCGAPWIISTALGLSSKLSNTAQVK